ncbi:hypothetical protein DSECCO2_588010 [anaerobic digester metagenome]
MFCLLPAAYIPLGPLLPNVLLRLGAYHAPVSQVTKKDERKGAKAFTRNANQREQRQRQGGEAQDNNFCGQRNAQRKDRDAHRNQQHTGFNGVSRLEHPAEKGAAVNEIWRDDIRIVFV